MNRRILVIGGGAAGFFSALVAKTASPSAHVTLFEKTARLLSKVRISGGGRCNVTHACFDPRELVKHYPRGHRELLGPFHRFQPRDTIAWFESRGVRLKTEEDGRIFPCSDSSEEIIQCLLAEAQRLNVEICMRSEVAHIERTESGFQFLNGEMTVRGDRLLLATGSDPVGHRWACELGHTIQQPVPSLFTFNIPDFPLADLAGITVEKAELSLCGSRLVQSGPLLITHWGFSGPAALKLSAWGARILHAQGYRVELKVNWVGGCSVEEVLVVFSAIRREQPSQMIGKHSSLGIARNLWHRLLDRAGIQADRRYAEINDHAFRRLSEVLTADRYRVEGKTTHKAEFVTCGGVTLSEVDFKTMESRRCPGLYFAGEVLDIDGVTGGFNFQNAWTTGFLAGTAIVA